MTLVTVDLVAWPNFIAMATVIGWLPLGEFDGFPRWYSGKSMEDVSATGPIGALVNPYKDEATVGHVYQPHGPIDGNWNPSVEVIMRHLATKYGEIATPTEAAALYEAFRQSYGADLLDEHGKCRGTWALIGDAADALLKRALEAP
jgi:hypothetical protein